MSAVQNKVAVDFFACTWEKAQAEVRRQRPCDLWIDDWPGVDFYWLFGDGYWWMQRQPDFSPLARRYYDQVTGEINAAIQQAINDCESQRYTAPGKGATGLSLTVASRLDQQGVRHSGNSSVGDKKGLAARLSVPFTPDSPPPPPRSCPDLPRELFTQPVDFGFVLPGPANNNFRWEWRDQVQPPPSTGVYFDLYGQMLAFTGSVGSEYLGSLHLIIDRLAELWVRFEDRPIPASAAARVDPNQPLRYQVSQGSGYFNIAAVVEVLHVESGAVYSASIHGPGYSPGQLPGYGPWPQGWESMSMDAGGVIRHGSVDLSYWLGTLDPAVIGLPVVGTYRLRYILLGYGYRTEARWVTSDVLGSGGDNRMSWKSLWFSVVPSLITYTPGLTEGMIPPFEYVYTRAPVLTSDASIGFEAVFDFKNLTTFRFVLKVANHLDFTVGVIVQAAGWQAWVSVPAGQTRYLAGAVSVSGLSNWNAYPLHPASPYYGWNRSWAGSYIAMASNGVCSIAFSLYLTAPTQPETLPANLPAKKATQRWMWDVSSWSPQNEPKWGAIKRYAANGQYDYDYNLQANQQSAGVLRSFNRTTTKPVYQPLIDPATYFVTGYDTSMYDWESPWHQRPWPTYSGWPWLTVPIMLSGEQQTWNGSQTVWTPVGPVSISLTRAMLQEVAAALGVTEYAVMDGDDIRWFQPGPNGAWSNVLWIDRFYTRAGTVIDAAAMRNAFNTVIAHHAGDWPSYRNLSVHASVRFGSFLDNGGFEVGDYLLGPNGDMVEVSGLSALSSVDTKFLYHISPEFQ